MNKLGPLGEQLAKDYLLNRGYKFIESNFRTRSGEIDLIMQDDEGLVFVEVKTRRSTNTVTPNDSLPEYKVNRIVAAANRYLTDKDCDDWRIELVAVTIMPWGDAKLRLIEI